MKEIMWSLIVCFQRPGKKTYFSSLFKPNRVTNHKCTYTVLQTGKCTQFTHNTEQFLKVLKTVPVAVSNKWNPVLLLS